jgi:hypothetical protein
MANCWPRHTGQKRFEDEVIKEEEKNRKKKPKKKKKELKKKIGIEQLYNFYSFVNNYLL